MPNYLTLTDLIDQGRQLFSLIGSFWPNYDQEDLVYQYIQGKNELWLETKQWTQELLASVSRLQIPVFHRERWAPLVLLDSQQLPNTPLVYGPTDVLGQPGGTSFQTATFDFTLPGQVTSFGFLVDEFINPAVYLAQNADYYIDLPNNRVRFASNPFTNPNLAPQPIYDTNGNIIDQSLTLWMGQANYDLSYVYQQFGYILQLGLPSSSNYKDLVNAIWDANLLGPDRDALDRMLSALFDAPVSRNDGEVVQVITADNDRQLVITDQAVYICGLDSTIRVAIGQILPIGTTLCDAFTVVDLSQGTPPPGQLASLTIPTNMLKGAFSGPLTWDNTLTPVNVSTVAGRTFVSWALGGAPSDVNLFFNTTQANGVMAGNKTLAQLLDTRPQPQSTDPDANSLPSQINPLNFLVSNILEYGALVVLVNPNSFGPNALDPNLTLISRVIRMVLNPTGTAIVMTV